MLQIETVRPACLALLKELMEIEDLKDFRLAGGTGLSLRLGHRISIDLDLFTNILFDVNELITFFKNYFGDRIQIYGSNRYGVFASIDNVKTNFLYRYEKFINIEDSFDKIRIASLDDIGAMKIHAAASRVSKKDYYDLFELLNVYTFDELIGFFSKMYPNYDIGSTLKSLTNFEENESDEDPISLRSVSWELIKEKMSLEIKNYVHSLQQKKLNAESKRHESINEIISKKKNKI